MVRRFLRRMMGKEMKLNQTAIIIFIKNKVASRTVSTKKKQGKEKTTKVLGLRELFRRK